MLLILDKGYNYSNLKDLFEDFDEDFDEGFDNQN